MTFTAGVQLGPYEIIQAIGAGGQGEVYRGRDARLGVLNDGSMCPATAISWI